MMMAHQDFGGRRAAVRRVRRAAQQLDRARRADAARRGRGTDGPHHHPGNPFPTRDDDRHQPLSHRRCGSAAMEHRDRQPAWRGRLARRVQRLGLRSSPCSARAARSEQSGDRSDGWVRTDFLQQQIDLGRVQPVRRHAESAGRHRRRSRTSLVRRGKSELTMYDATDLRRRCSTSATTRCGWPRVSSIARSRSRTCRTTSSSAA